MTGLDLAVRASRPRGLSDALAGHLAVQVARNDRLVSAITAQASQITAQDAKVARLEADLDGMHTANERLWADREKHRKIADALREDYAALVRQTGGAA